MPAIQSAVRFKFVGVDAHIDPAVQTILTIILGEFVTALGPMWASAPTRIIPIIGVATIISLFIQVHNKKK